MKNFLYSLFIGLFGMTGLTSIAFLWMYAAQSKQQAHLYSDLAAVRKQDTQQETASEPEKQASYQNLYWENTDMVGWILIEDTNIDYPVMQTPTDPTYYLKHDFEKNYTDYGCPFMQADCDALCPSDNLIIYGHNMKDGSMFADLAKYRSKDFWQTHKTVWFDTALGSCAYEIFCRDPHDRAGRYRRCVSRSIGLWTQQPRRICRLCVGLPSAGAVRYRHFS